VGTNYYLLKGGTSPCPTCGHAEPPISEHIGKSSGGWCFSLHVGPFEDGETGQGSYRDLEDWKAEWSKPGARIEDEYGRAVDPDEMYQIIADRKGRDPGKDGKEEYWPKGWWESPISSRYKSEEDFHRSNHSRRGPSGLLRCREDGCRCVGHGSGTWDMITGEFS
jgi:hypothetical protein